jgi:hypothetical protein
VSTLSALSSSDASLGASLRGLEQVGAQVGHGIAKTQAHCALASAAQRRDIFPVHVLEDAQQDNELIQWVGDRVKQMAGFQRRAYLAGIVVARSADLNDIWRAVASAVQPATQPAVDPLPAITQMDWLASADLSAPAGVTQGWPEALRVHLSDGSVHLVTFYG